ncbi:MAG: hypothetical protein ACP5IX_03520 [Patescibacteria group bacterium]
MKNKHLFVAIEGVDGVGKTTIANLLSERIKAIHLKNSSFLKQIARLIDKAHCSIIEIIFYLLLNIYRSIQVSYLIRYKSVICEKYILTTIVDQSCLGAKLIRYIKNVRYKLVRKPDYTFCLTVFDKNELLQRLRLRGRLDTNDKQLLPYWSAIQNMYRQFEFEEVIIIDTTNKTPTEVLDSITKLLKI